MFVSLRHQNQTKMRLTIKLFVPTLALATVLGSCGDSADKTEKEAVTVEDSNFDSDEEDYVLPQPISLAQMFKEAGLTYSAGKANSPRKKGEYSQKIDQLLNLGVYSTDLAYCAINNKTQEAREYLVAVQYLGSKVGLESVFSNKEMIDRFDKNLGDQGALEELIYDIQDKTDVYLDDNNMRYLASIEFAGAWTEGIYLGIDDSKKKGSELGVALVEQMILLENIIKGLKSHPAKEDQRLKEVISSFEKVLATYKGFETVKKAGSNKNFTAAELTAVEFEALAKEITNLRNSIVSPK